MPPARVPERLPPLPWLPAALLRALLPHAERDEVLDDLAGEYGDRAGRDGRWPASAWVWRQVLQSVPSLLRRSWWRGWSGFEPQANRTRPGGPMLESWIMDVRYATRRLRSRPTYTLLAVLTLALGVGGTAAIYSIVRGLLVDPLPYRAEEQIAVFWSPFDWTEQEFLYLRSDFAGFSQVAAYRTGDLTLQLGDAPARLVPAIASSFELFDVLGTAPLLGRGFRDGDDRTGAEPVVVLSHGLWQELGGDASIVGQRLRLDGAERTVVGVMPRGFWFPDPTVRAWVPTPLLETNQSGNYAFVGRVAPGQRIEAMGPAMSRLVARLDERYDYPAQWDKTKNTTLTPVREFLVGSLRPALLATLAAMGLILLIACANVATLMLGQVDSRASELAVRSALGADRRRLTQQLIAEALAVGLAAGAVGALLAAVAFRFLVAALPLGAWAETATLRWSVFFTAMAIAVAAALVIALAPVVSLWRGDLRGALTRARTSGIGGRGGSMESSLVVAEVALAVLMAAGAGLLIRSVAKLYDIDPGVNTTEVAVLDISTGGGLTAPQRRVLLKDLSREVGALPGVRSVAAAQRLPLRGGGDNWGIDVEGKPELETTTTAFRVVTPGYLEAMGMKLRSGRTPAESDGPNAERVVVINQALADKYFPGEDPIGRQLGTGFEGWERIVGVVGTAAEGKLTDDPTPARYMLYEQVPYVPEDNSLVIRVQPGRDPAAVLDAARRTVQRVAPSVAVQEATTMGRVFAKAVGPARQVMALLAILTTLALVLGAVGVYGVITHFVNRRKRDWSIRIALGQAPGHVIGQVVGRGARLIVAGIVVGLVAAVALARLIASLLYGVGTADPLSLAGATSALLAVGLLAAWIPGYRASRTDPALVLREQ